MLKKLSLAALVAMGSLSVASAATPLEQAIKNVSLSGFLRVRLYNEDPDGKAVYNRWRTNGVLIFKVPVAENFNFVMRNSVQTNVYTNKTRVGTEKKPLSGNKSTNVDDGIVNNLLFIQYANGPLSAIVGKIPVATSITSADPAAPGHGAGVVATYNVNENLTFAGAFVDALKNPGNNTGLSELGLIGNDVYALAALFNTDYVNGNVWYYHVTEAVDHIVTLSLNANVPNVDGLTVHGDFATGKLDSDLAKSKGLKHSSHKYYNISAKYKYDAFCGQLGYAKSNDKDGIVELSADAPIGAVIPTFNNYNIANLKDASAVYAKLGYNVDPKTNVYVAGQWRDGGDYNDDLNEYTIGVNYAVNKKLKFHAHYDIADFDKNSKIQNHSNDNNEFMVEAKYSF